MLSLVLVGVGLLGLILPVIRVVSALRRLGRARKAVTDGVADRSRLLRARLAGLRVALPGGRRGG